MDGVGLSVLVAIASLVVAIVSLWPRFRAHRQAERKARREDPSLSLYLRDAVTEVLSNANYRIWSFSLVVTNRSDRANSVVDAECRISYRTSGDYIHNFAIPVHAGDDHRAPPADDLRVPFRLEGSEAKAGLLSFGAPESTLAGHYIVGYVVVLKDAFDREYSLEPIVVEERGR